MKHFADILKRHGTLILAVLLVISLFGNAIQHNDAAMRDYDSIVGTYCFGNQTAGEGEYIALASNGTYWRYQQFKMLEQGTYKIDYDEIYTVSPSSNPDENWKLIFIGENANHPNRLYIYDSKTNSVCPFDKIADTPALINVP